ncbi:MAG: DinB family protein [Tepidiformaceae bacterium]
MNRAERDALVARYRDGHRVVCEAVAGLSQTALDHRPADGSWSARMVVHHLTDSEMMSAIRLRRLLAEEQPQIDAYDEELFARMLYYGTRPIGPSLDALRTARETSAQILDCIAEQDWGRAGTHSESGRYSVEDWLTIYAAHAHDHAAQIERAVSG